MPLLTFDISCCHTIGRFTTGVDEGQMLNINRMQTDPIEVESARCLISLRRIVATVAWFSIWLSAYSAELPRHAVLGAGVVDKNGVRIALIIHGSAAERGGLRVDDRMKANHSILLPNFFRS